MLKKVPNTMFSMVLFLNCLVNHEVSILPYILGIPTSKVSTRNDFFFVCQGHNVFDSFWSPPVARIIQENLFQ